MVSIEMTMLTRIALYLFGVKAAAMIKTGCCY